MIQQNNEAFEKAMYQKFAWNNTEHILQNPDEYSEMVYLCIYYANEGWQAAKADSEREIAELKAHINVLREALVEVVNRTESFGIESIAQKALASTPAQSLVEHDNEVIERCAKVCISKANELKQHIDEGAIVGKADTGAIVCAQEIRALKAKP